MTWIAIFADKKYCREDPNFEHLTHSVWVCIQNLKKKLQVTNDLLNWSNTDFVTREIWNLRIMIIRFELFLHSHDSQILRFEKNIRFDDVQSKYERICPLTRHIFQMCIRFQNTLYFIKTYFHIFLKTYFNVSALKYLHWCVFQSKHRQKYVTIW